MIQREYFYSPGIPPVVGDRIAHAPCGCQVGVGYRTDTKEAATVSQLCCDGHKEMITRFRGRLIASLEDPTSLPLIEVVDEMLQAIYAEEVQ